MYWTDKFDEDEADLEIDPATRKLPGVLKDYQHAQLPTRVGSLACFLQKEALEISKGEFRAYAVNKELINSDMVVWAEGKDKEMQYSVSVPLNSIAYRRHVWTRSAKESFNNAPLQRKMDIVDGFRNRFPDVSPVFTIVIITIAPSTLRSKFPMVVLPSVYQHSAVVIVDESAKKPIICASARDLRDKLPNHEGIERYIKRKSNGKLRKKEADKLLGTPFWRNRGTPRGEGAYIVLEAPDRADLYDSDAQEFFDNAQFDNWGEVRKRIFALIEEEGPTWIRAREHRKSFLFAVKPKPEDRVIPPEYPPVTHEIVVGLIEEEAEEAAQAALDDDNDKKGKHGGSDGKAKKRKPKGGSTKKSKATSTPATKRETTKPTAKTPTTADEKSSGRPVRSTRHSGGYKIAVPLFEEEYEDVLPFAGGQESEDEFGS